MKTHQFYRAQFFRVCVGLMGIVSVGCASSQYTDTSQRSHVYENDTHTQLIETDITPPRDYTPPEAEQLTSVGENGEAYFDSTGKRLIFQSKNRPAHSNTQIYLLNLEDLEKAKKKNRKKTKEGPKEPKEDVATSKTESSESIVAETRITSHGGEDTCSYFDPRNPNQIIYASTEDEMSEHTEPNNTEGDFSIRYKAKQRKYEWKFHPHEIYKYNLKTKQKTRLTHSVGYDAEGTFNTTGNKIVYTSIRDGDLELYTMDRDGMNQQRITKIKGYDGGAFYSPDDSTLLWRGFHLPDGTCHLYTSDVQGENRKQLTIDKGIHWCPSWHPSGEWIIYSSNRAGVGNFELYITTADGSCHKRLTYSAKNDILAIFSPDGKTIVFTSDRSGQSHLYRMDFVIPDTPCLELTPHTLKAEL